jgi:hypothetical protein
VNESAHTDKFELSAPFASAHQTAPTHIEVTPADVVDDSAAISAVCTVVFVIVVLALVLVFLSHPGGRK